VQNGNTITQHKTIQHFLERLFGHSAEHTIHITLNNVQGPAAVGLAIRYKAGSLFPVAPVHNRRLKIGNGFTLYYDTTSPDLLAAQSDPNITYIEGSDCPRGKKRNQLAFTGINIGSNSCHYSFIG
jgi:hypothetical protein